MKRVKYYIIPCVATCVLSVVTMQRSHAALIVFTDRAAWEAAAGSFVTEDFDSLPLTNFVTGVNSAGLIDIRVIGDPNANRIAVNGNDKFYLGETTKLAPPGTAELLFPNSVLASPG